MLAYHIMECVQVPVASHCSMLSVYMCLWSVYMCLPITVWSVCKSVCMPHLSHITECLWHEYVHHNVLGIYNAFLSTSYKVWTACMPCLPHNTVLGVFKHNVFIICITTRRGCIVRVLFEMALAISDNGS